MKKDCLFCNIANGDGKKVFENDDFVIINDIAPQAKLHYLAIPKKHFADIEDLAKNDPELLARIFKQIASMISQLGLNDGYRIITNAGKNGCQSVHHIHIHILGGEQLGEKMG